MQSCSIKSLQTLSLVSIRSVDYNLYDELLGSKVMIFKDLPTCEWCSGREKTMKYNCIDPNGNKVCDYIICQSCIMYNTWAKTWCKMDELTDANLLVSEDENKRTITQVIIPFRFEITSLCLDVLYGSA